MRWILTTAWQTIDHPGVGQRYHAHMIKMAPAASALVLAVLSWTQASPSQARQSLPTTPEAILRDLESGNYQTLRRALIAARTIRDDRVPEKLFHLIAHARHPNIRGYACETLGHYRGPKIFSVLKTAADGPLSTRMGALPGLGLLGDPRSFDPLAKALGDRHSWGYAATGLRHLGDPRGAGVLAKLFRTHLHDHFVHGAVAETILALDRDVAVELFFESMQDERIYRLHTLDRLLGETKTKAVRDRAQRLLDHEQEELRIRGIRILGGAGDVSTVAVLLTVMEKAKASPEERIAAIAALGEMGHELAVAQLARHFRSDDPDQRAAVAEALGKIGHETATRPLVLALRKEEHIVPKLQLIAALGRVGDRRAVGDLGEFLDDTSTHDQPLEISAIWVFPCNTPVNLTAWWALSRIRHGGKEPADLRTLFSFHGRGEKVSPDDLESATKWWKEHRKKPGYHVDK